MDDWFDPTVSEKMLFKELARLRFVKIAQGHSAHVYGDTSRYVVLKVFPEVGIGSAREIASVRGYTLLRYLEKCSLRLQGVPLISWMRAKGKSLLADVLSRKNPEARRRASRNSIDGYRSSITRGLMPNVPTRIIRNCVSQLDIVAPRRLLEHYSRPEELVLQRWVDPNQVARNVLQRICAEGGSSQECHALIKSCVDNEVRLWRHGVINTDLSFNTLDSHVMLSDGSVELYDANNISEKKSTAQWFIEQKERDINGIMRRVEEGRYPEFLFDAEFASIVETARTMYRLLPTDRRDDVVFYFLKLAKTTLSEENLRRNWGTAEKHQAHPCLGVS